MEINSELACLKLQIGRKGRNARVCTSSMELYEAVVHMLK